MDISELYQIYQAHPVITTDSRDCPEGSIFLALKGASFDGNKFADMALEKGCAYVIVDEKEYELETKGTISNYYSKFKKDILDKKNNKKMKDVYFRFGTIAMINNSDDLKDSKCVVVDDPPNEDIKPNFENSFETQLLNYGIFLSYILDSKYYNKYIKPLKKNQYKKVKINVKKFFTKYIFNNKEYYGECFDYRLIL